MSEGAIRLIITLSHPVLRTNIQENWTVEPDSTKESSHCPVSPAYILFTDIAGIRPAAPGFSKCTVPPQLQGLDKLELTFHTVRGARPIPLATRLPLLTGLYFHARLPSLFIMHRPYEWSYSQEYPFTVGHDAPDGPEPAPQWTNRLPEFYRIRRCSRTAWKETRRLGGRL